MKASAEFIAQLQERVGALDTPERREGYCLGQFPRADRVKDLNKRYRWDLFWDSGVEVPEGLADAHIDTALRQVVKPL